MIQQPTVEVDVAPVALSDKEHLRVVRWRSEQLLADGFTIDQVFRMNPARPTFDYHEAERLLRDGKTHEQVTWRLEDV